jgi:hypothetical protein
VEKRTRLLHQRSRPLFQDRSAELLHRVLLGLITVLIVARPLVLGEDPGLTSRLSGGANLVLNLLWFITAVGWACWRAWSRPRGFSVDLIEIGLAVLVGLIFVSTTVAHYKHPAWLIAWEWLVLFLAFSLVRRLAVSPADCHALVAALVASGVSVSAQAAYQYTVELPRTRHALEDPAVLRQELAKLDVQVEVDDPRLEMWKKRIQMDNVFATFAHPNAFAGYLVLLLPMAFGWNAVAWRSGGRRRIVLVSISLLLLGSALWWTHSRGAVLGLFVVALTALFLWVRKKRGAWAAVGTLVAVVGISAAVFYGASRITATASGTEKFWESSGKRTDYWIATWRMIREHPWLGIGPGNFGSLYPRYMLERAYEKIQDPHSFLLEIWATSGIFAVLTLLATLGVFFWRIGNPWRVVSPTLEREDLLSEVSPTRQRGDPSLAHRANVNEIGEPSSSTHWVTNLRWECLIGGMVGLILGFVLRAVDETTEGVVTESILSVVRTAVWLTAFVVFSALPWTGRWRPLALAAGVAALLINLLFSGGIALPSVAEPFWIVIALALSLLTPAASASRPSDERNIAWSSLPLPVLLGLTLAHLFLVFLPVTGCLNLLANARRYMAAWHTETTNRLSPIQASYYVHNHIVKTLEAAAAEDPDYAVPPLELASWYMKEASLSPQGELLSKKALGEALRAQHLDPDSKEGFLTEYQIFMRLAESTKSEENKYYAAAAKAMQQAVKRDPTEARLHYQLAEALFHLQEVVQARREAERAHELDALATHPERQLTERERQQLPKWLESRPNP